ncbi:putative Ig domain-containing protein, partial [Pseudomonas sp. PSB11]|uniref:putative Ig domain-containing protein n=1 Tax=Pseudomonas sp. PSB11 TaxID=2021969 RepID=UPI001661707B
SLLTTSSGYSGGNPFDAALGYLRLVQQGADTLLQWDQNGTASGGAGWSTVITLQHTVASSLTIDNFSPSTSITGIEVVNLNTPPEVSSPLADQAATEDDVFSFTVPVGTFNDSDAGDTLTYSAILADGSPLPSWLSFDAASRSFSGTPGNGEVGSLSIKVIATDRGNLSASSSFTLSVGNTNDTPTVTGPVSLANGVEDQSYTLTAAQLLANASDVDVGDTLSVQSVSVDPADGSLTDNGNGTWTYSPAANRNGAVSFTVVISDGSASIITAASLDLAPVIDAPTLQIPLANQLSGLGHAFSYSLPVNTFADVDVGDSLMLSATLAGGDPLPAWLSFDAASHTFSGTPLAGTPAGAIEIVVTATDSGGLSVSEGFSLNLLDAIVGTPNPDTLNGSVVADAIYGLEGGDQLFGFGGDDLLDGGAGRDTVYGGQGNDTLLAGNDSDGSFLSGEEGNDTLVGSSGDDSMDGGAGSDVLQGGNGNDTLQDYDFSGLVATNSLDAGAGNDTINVYQSNSGSVTTVSGGAGRDTYLLRASAQGQMLVSDFAPGSAGDILSINDLLTSSSGYSAGNPFDPALGYLRLVQQGADTLLQWDQNGTAAGGTGWRTIITLQNTVASNLTIDNFAPAAPPDGSAVGLTLIGTPNPDTLNGSVVADAIYGLEGGDQLFGFGGDDLLDGGAGRDTVYGGQGNDTLLAGNDSDGSFLSGEEGNDTLVGSSGDDSMDGGAGSDVLQGGNGNDTLQDYDFSGLVATNSLDAGAGNDTINVYQSNSGSVTTVSGGAGRDTYVLRASAQGQLLVSDFAPGSAGDILSINDLLTSSSGYSAGNPFDPALGYLRLVQQGADTLLQWDQNGTAAGGTGWRTIITLQNTVASNLT